MLLLATDFHLDDQKANQYRWEVFDKIHQVCQSYPVERVYCLGDVTDTSDRFSAVLVNRFVECWKKLPPSVILRGNHDTTISGPAFWEFMSSIPGVEYVTRPTLHDDLLLLPYSPNPKVEWQGLPFDDCEAIFIHATRTGTIAENGYPLTGQDLPVIPRRIKVYSGDVHTQQVVDNWVYVGASHPVKYGDRYPCRFLLLDEQTYEVVEEIKIETIGKRSIDIGSLADLAGIETRPGDQVKINCSVSPGELDWGSFEQGVDAWARERNVVVVFGSCSYDVPVQSGSEVNAELDPEDLLREFARGEGVPDSLLDVGLALLREVSSVGQS